jgi:hypothetical protein
MTGGSPLGPTSADSGADCRRLSALLQLKLDRSHVIHAPSFFFSCHGSWLQGSWPGSCEGGVQGRGGAAEVDGGAE